MEKLVKVKLNESIKVMLPGKGNLTRKPDKWVGDVSESQYNRIAAYCEKVEPEKIVIKSTTPTKSNNNKGKKVK